MGAIKRLKDPGPFVMVVILVTGIVFMGTLSADFVMWDDDISIYQNPNLTGLSLSTLILAFIDSSSIVRFAPISQLAWNAIHDVFGLNPFGYHLANWTLHLLNSALLFSGFQILLRKGFSLSGSDSFSRLLRLNLSAMIAALFWSLNPLRVETVAWASTLTYNLAAFFFFLSIHFYIRALTIESEPRRYQRMMAVSILLYTASVLSHPIVISGFLILPLIDVFLKGRLFPAGERLDRRYLGKYILEKAAFAVPAILATLATIVFRHVSSASLVRVAAFSDLDLPDRLAQAAYATLYYAYRPFFPVDLSIVYTTFLSFDRYSPPFMASMAILFFIGLLAYALHKKARAVPVATCAFVILSIPVMGLLENPFFHSDRYTHIATVPLAALVGSGLFILFGRFSIKWILPLPIAGLVVLSVMSMNQIRIWQNTESLFTHAIQELGDHPYRGDLYMRLGKFRFENNRTEAAESALRQTLEINPYDQSANDFLSEIEFQRGDHKMAIGRMKMILARDPNNYLAHSKLAYIYHVLRQSDKAAYHYKKATETKGAPTSIGAP